MNDHVSSLYTLAHELLNLGMDDSPIYSDHFARLNREVYEQALRLYSAPEGDTPEEEARLCLSILVALNATFYDNGRKQQYIQHLLDRCWNVLDRLPASLLKVRLLTCCYGEVYEEEFPKNPGDLVFSVEYLPGQFDQRADSAMQCVKLLKEDEEPVIRTATTYVISTADSGTGRCHPPFLHQPG